MGKYKKKLRQERAKVKLKAQKTVLGKAQNITDTSFKVKKIVLRDLVKKNEDEPLSRKKHNVKELLSKLQHHNITMKKEGLEELKELTNDYTEEILGSHLSKIVEGTAKLLLDQEKDVRKSALNLFRSVLSQVPATKIAPFFNALSSYLSCGMTHISTSIQEDSLQMFDILLVSTPLLVAANSNKLLPNFLNMISCQKSGNTSERSLSVNLSRRYTTSRWRIQVLIRLHNLFAAMVMHNSEKNNNKLESNKSTEGMTPHLKYDSEMDIPIYNSHYTRVCNLTSLFDVSSTTMNPTFIHEENHLKNYSNVLMPLLIETWMEVGPDNNKQTNSVNHQVLSPEAAELLKCILEIIQLLYELLQMFHLFSEADEFIRLYKKQFLRHLFRGFPYTYADYEEKHQMEKNKYKNKQNELNIQTRCLEQNLALCHLFCCFCKKKNLDTDICNSVLNYVTKNIENWKYIHGHQMLQLLRYLLLKCSKSWNKKKIHFSPLLEAIVDSNMAHRDLDSFLLLIDVALDPRHSHLHRNESFQRWLGFLPELLCKPTIQARTITMLAKLACQNNANFNESLCKKLPQILDNLADIKITGAENDCEGKKTISNIFYWIKDWPKDVLRQLKMHLQSGKWDEELASHITKLLSLREYDLSEIDEC